MNGTIATDGQAPADPAGDASASPPDPGAVVAQLFREHNRDLVQFIRARIGAAAVDANEVAQESYVRLLQLGDTRAISFLRAYLFKIAANLVLDRLAANRRRHEDQAPPQDELEQLASPLDIERQFLADEDYRTLMTCIDELPPKCRQAFLMHRLSQKPSQEVARVMGISTRMVRKHITRAVVYCRYRLDGCTPAEALARLGDEHE